MRAHYVRHDHCLIAQMREGQETSSHLQALQLYSFLPHPYSPEECDIDDWRGGHVQADVPRVLSHDSAGDRENRGANGHELGFGLDYE